MLKYRCNGTLTRPTHRKEKAVFIEEDVANSSTENEDYMGVGEERVSSGYWSWGHQSSSPSPCTSNASSNCRLRGRSSSVSSLSSAGSNNDSGPQEWGRLKIYTGDIRPETEYKTLLISSATTAADVISAILSKFRMTSRDPRLFRLAMEIKTKKEGGDITTRLYLRNDSKPLELEQCHPKGQSRFILHADLGVLVRVYDYLVSHESNYKSIMISRETSCHEAIRLVLQISRLQPSPEQFVLVGIDFRSGSEFVLPREAGLATLVENGEDSEEGRLRVHLRRLDRAVDRPSDSPISHRFVRRNSTRTRPSFLTNNSSGQLAHYKDHSLQFERRFV